MSPDRKAAIISEIITALIVCGFGFYALGITLNVSGCGK